MPTATINTLEGSFTIEDPGSTFDLQNLGVWRNGIVQLQAPPVASVVCGTTDRPAEVTIEALDQVPAAPDSQWEAVAEVSLVAVTGRLRIREWASAPHPELEVSGLPIGSIRVRVSAQGRDTRERERFLIQAWPAPEAPDEVLRQDRFGRNFQ